MNTLQKTSVEKSLYQIAEITSESFNAGPKAIQDVITVAEKEGFKLLPVHVKFPGNSLKNRILRQICFEREWKSIDKSVENNSIVLLQNPFRSRQLIREKTLTDLKRNRNIKYICFVHDIEPLRVNDQHLGKYHEHYFEHEYRFMLEIADVLIVHNEVMKQYIISSTDFPADKIVSLKLFDYLRDEEKSFPVYKKIINIAGNLDLQYRSYLKRLNKVDCEFQLYGPNYTDMHFDNVRYGGVIEPEKLPGVLNSGYGLVWDGDDIETCSGPAGKYLKYNNPHKLSLYMSAGIPVFIWNKAAEAKFVTDHQAGFAISSLNEIPGILNRTDEQSYREMAGNVRKISNKIVRGYYTETALNKALNVIKET